MNLVSKDKVTLLNIEHSSKTSINSILIYITHIHSFVVSPGLMVMEYQLGSHSCLSIIAALFPGFPSLMRKWLVSRGENFHFSTCIKLPTKIKDCFFLTKKHQLRKTYLKQLLFYQLLKFGHRYDCGVSVPCSHDNRSYSIRGGHTITLVQFCHC